MNEPKLISMEEAEAYVAERDRVRAETTALRLRVAEMEGRAQLYEAQSNRFYEQICTEPARTRAAVVTALRELLRREQEFAGNTYTLEDYIEEIENGAGL